MAGEEWTQERLAAVAGEWQNLLRLQAWRLGVEFCDDKELNPDHEAEVEFLDEWRHARIRIMEPGQHPETFLGDPWDVEQALVHELVHILERPIRLAMDAALQHAAPAAREALWAQYDMAREQMINTFADVLVALKRGGDHGPQGGVPPPGTQGPGADGAGKAGGPAPADNGPDPQDPHAEAAPPPAP